MPEIDKNTGKNMRKEKAIKLFYMIFIGGLIIVLFKLLFPHRSTEGLCMQLCISLPGLERSGRMGQFFCVP